MGPAPSSGNADADHPTGPLDRRCAAVYHVWSCFFYLIPGLSPDAECRWTGPNTLLLALLGILLLSAVAAAVWLIAGVAALGLWLLMEVVLPGLTRRDWLHLKQERNRSNRTWRQLAELSLLDMLLCRLPRGR